jgi:hypothetical protein
MSLEHWKYDAGSDTVASLVIPAALDRKRTFDLDATLQVRVPPHAADASHELIVEVDGQRLWARRIPSHPHAESDSLDYHHRLVVQPGADCRVRAMANCKGSQVQSLVVEARETPY